MSVPQPSSACPACARLERVRAGVDPLFICELRRSYVLLHKHQAYAGWCSLFVKEHAEHLDRMSEPQQRELWEDVMHVSAAIRRAMNPRRLNYENLGNVVPHVHWHIIPRYDAPTDPDPGNVVWVRPSTELECGVDPERAKELILRLRDAGLGTPQ
jgi:diadenosine tetraphosphate (Ap4A) HIT family hydrolase